MAETGCGALTAAVLIGCTAGAERFATDAHFARQAGVAPIACSSGQTIRHRLHRGGDRQLNHALHIIAVTRARPSHTTFKVNLQARDQDLRQAQRSLLDRTFRAPPPAGGAGCYGTLGVNSLDGVRSGCTVSGPRVA